MQAFASIADLGWSQCVQQLHAAREIWVRSYFSVSVNGARQLNTNTAAATLTANSARVSLQTAVQETACSPGADHRAAARRSAYELYLQALQAYCEAMRSPDNPHRLFAASALPHPAQQPNSDAKGDVPIEEAARLFKQAAARFSRESDKFLVGKSQDNLLARATQASLQAGPISSFLVWGRKSNFLCGILSSLARRHSTRSNRRSLRYVLAAVFHLHRFLCL